jgi:sigma-B regulation protein RsbU (phosphoserine phosphatase)
MKLRSRLAIGFVLLMILMALGLHGTAWLREKALQEEVQGSLLVTYERAFAAALEKHDLIVRRQIEPELAARPSLAANLADRRFAELRIDLSGLFDGLSARGVTALQVLDDQNRVVFAAPRLPGDAVLIDPLAATEALVSGRGTGGMEKAGESLLQVTAIPLRNKDRTVGLLLVGRSPQPLLQDVAGQTGAGVVLADADGRVLASAGGKDVSVLAERSRRMTRGTDELHLGDQVQVVATLPLVNAAGARIGLQRWFIESTESRWASDQRRLSSYGIDALVFGGLTLLGLWAIRRAFRPLDSTLEALRGLAHGDTSVEIIGEERRDEVGQTAQALHVFRDGQLELSRAGERRTRQRRRQLRFIRRQMEKLSETLDEGTKAELMEDMARIELQARAEQGQGDSLDALAVAFRVMTERVSAQHANLVMLVHELRDAVARQKQMEALKEQLAVVGRLQKSLLPRSFPPRAEAEVRGELAQGTKMGADFFDFFLLDDRRLALFAGTVAGDGIPAAFLAVTARALVRASLAASPGPAACLMRLSDQLLADNEQMLDVLATLAVLDIRDGTLAAAVAGYPLPLLATRPGEARLVEWPQSSPLATRPGVKVEQTVQELTPRTSLMFYSPGALRAQRDGRALGADGVAAILKDGDDLGADAVIGRGLIRLTEGEVTREDDASLVVLRYRGPA